MKFFTSDWHIGHENVIHLSNRPFANIYQMNQALIENFNKVVTPDDTCYFLGDMSFNHKLSCDVLSRLNGTKVLVRGNHDQKPQRMSKQGYDLVCERMDILLFGKRLTLSHYPFKPTRFSSINVPWWKRWAYGVEDSVRHFHRRPKDEGQWLLHGHTHSKKKVKGRMIHVGVDAWDMCPVSQHEIQKIINKEEK